MLDNLLVMDSNKQTPKVHKAEEPSVAYTSSKPSFKGIDRENFDFDKEFNNGLTPEEAKEESIRLIREWWKK